MSGMYGRITKPGRLLQSALGAFNIGDATRCSIIARRARTYRRKMEEACSYEWAQGDAWDRSVERLERSIESAVAQLGHGYGVEFSGDPRGACVFIKTPDGRTDDWGRRGICALQD